MTKPGGGQDEGQHVKKFQSSQREDRFGFLSEKQTEELAVNQAAGNNLYPAAFLFQVFFIDKGIIVIHVYLASVSTVFSELQRSAEAQPEQPVQVPPFRLRRMLDNATSMTSRMIPPRM